MADEHFFPGPGDFPSGLSAAPFFGASYSYAPPPGLDAAAAMQRFGLAWADLQLPDSSGAAHFDSALSSLVSSPAHNGSGCGYGGDDVAIGDLIGRLGSICGGAAASASNSCYSTPLSSPPRGAAPSPAFRGCCGYPGGAAAAALETPGAGGRLSRVANSKSLGAGAATPASGSPEAEASRPEMVPMGSGSTGTRDRDPAPPAKKRKASGKGKATSSAKVGEGKAGDDADTAAEKEPAKDYIHVRARRGQATDSHSLAERVSAAGEDQREDEDAAVPRARLQQDHGEGADAGRDHQLRPVAAAPGRVPVDEAGDDEPRAGRGRALPGGRGAVGAAPHRVPLLLRPVVVRRGRPPGAAGGLVRRRLPPRLGGAAGRPPQRRRRRAPRPQPGRRRRARARPVRAAVAAGARQFPPRQVNETESAGGGCHYSQDSEIVSPLAHVLLSVRRTVVADDGLGRSMPPRCMQDSRSSGGSEPREARAAVVNARRCLAFLPGRRRRRRLLYIRDATPAAVPHRRASRLFPSHLAGAVSSSSPAASPIGDETMIAIRGLATRAGPTATEGSCSLGPQRRSILLARQRSRSSSLFCAPAEVQAACKSAMRGSTVARKWKFAHRSIVMPQPAMQFLLRVVFKKKILLRVW